jgi:hypothetical protein
VIAIDEAIDFGFGSDGGSSYPCACRLTSRSHSLTVTRSRGLTGLLPKTPRAFLSRDRNELL